MVASAAHTGAATLRSSHSTASSPTATPTAKVVRPEATLHQSASAPSTAGPSGHRTPVRTTRQPSTQVPPSPASTETVLAPSPAIRYGVSRL